ncbi:MAG: transposase [Candidatus Rokubacteria bacterium]|nr:transposase [Candidatus Rokubacteria bacterium]
MTVIQRFGGGLNLNVHFHTLVLEGVFVEGADGRCGSGSCRRRRTKRSGCCSRRSPHGSRVCSGTIKV